VSAALGHSESSTTLKIYSHVIVEAKAVAMDKIGERLERLNGEAGS
jgi:hypothetical protein